MSAPQAPPAAAAPVKRGSKLPILAAAGVLLVGGGVVAFRMLRKEPEAPAEPVKKPVVIEPGVVELDPYILNLADPAGDRYFRLVVQFVLDQKPIAQRAADGLAQVKLRDRILAVLAKKRASELTSVEGKEALRAEVHGVTEALLAEPPFFVAESDPAPAHVLEVFFTEFLVQ